MLCPNCGKEAVEGAKFCSYCGHDIPTGSDPARSQDGIGADGQAAQPDAQAAALPNAQPVPAQAAALPNAQPVPAQAAALPDAQPVPAQSAALPDAQPAPAQAWHPSAPQPFAPQPYMAPPDRQQPAQHAQAQAPNVQAPNVQAPTPYWQQGPWQPQQAWPPPPWQAQPQWQAAPWQQGQQGQQAAPPWQAPPPWQAVPWQQGQQGQQGQQAAPPWQAPPPWQAAPWQQGQQGQQAAPPWQAQPQWQAAPWQGQQPWQAQQAGLAAAPGDGQAAAPGAGLPGAEATVAATAETGAAQAGPEQAGAAQAEAAQAEAAGRAAPPAEPQAGARLGAPAPEWRAAANEPPKKATKAKKKHVGRRVALCLFAALVLGGGAYAWFQPGGIPGALQGVVDSFGDLTGLSVPKFAGQGGAATPAPDGQGSSGGAASKGAAGGVGAGEGAGTGATASPGGATAAPADGDGAASPLFGESPARGGDMLSGWLRQFARGGVDLGWTAYFDASVTDTLLQVLLNLVDAGDALEGALSMLSQATLDAAGAFHQERADGGLRPQLGFDAFLALESVDLLAVQGYADADGLLVKSPDLFDGVLRLTGGAMLGFDRFLGAPPEAWADAAGKLAGAAPAAGRIATGLLGMLTADESGTLSTDVNGSRVEFDAYTYHLTERRAIEARLLVIRELRQDEGAIAFLSALHPFGASLGGASLATRLDFERALAAAEAAAEKSLAALPEGEGGATLALATYCRSASGAGFLLEVNKGAAWPALEAGFLYDWGAGYSCWAKAGPEGVKTGLHGSLDLYDDGFTADIWLRGESPDGRDVDGEAGWVDFTVYDQDDAVFDVELYLRDLLAAAYGIADLSQPQASSPGGGASALPLPVEGLTEDMVAYFGLETYGGPLFYAGVESDKYASYVDAEVGFYAGDGGVVKPEGDVTDLSGAGAGEAGDVIAGIWRNVAALLEKAESRGYGMDWARGLAPGGLGEGAGPTMPPTVPRPLEGTASPERTASTATPGRTARAATPGRTASAATPERTATPAPAKQPAGTASAKQPASAAPPAQPGSTAAPAQPGSAAAPGRTAASGRGRAGR
jgi:hypothetical protein